MTNSVITTIDTDMTYGATFTTDTGTFKWLSRRQQTVETSVSSSEFIALKHCIEDTEHLSFKLRMFGIPIEGNGEATHVLCDNKSVVTNTSNVESLLNKKHSPIVYHSSRMECCYSSVLIAWIPTGDNLADAMMICRLTCGSDC